MFGVGAEAMASWRPVFFLGGGGFASPPPPPRNLRNWLTLTWDLRPVPSLSTGLGSQRYEHNVDTDRNDIANDII